MIRRSINSSLLAPRPFGVSKILGIFQQFILSCAHDRSRKHSHLCLPKYAPVLADRDCRSSYYIRAYSSHLKLTTSGVQTDSAHALNDVFRYVDEGDADESGSRAASTFLDLVNTDVIFVCVDFEASELDGKTILEFGVATLDTRDMVRMPSQYGDLWNKKIHSHHVIIEENAHLVNSKYIEGRPEEFQFGKSLRLNSRAAAAFFRNAFDRQDESEKTQATKEMFASLECRPETFPSASRIKSQIIIDLQRLVNSYAVLPSRKFVLVGHALTNDKEYMNEFGINLDENPDIIAELDTQRLVSTAGYHRSLTRLLRELGIPAQCLHNSGNDATYTLRALIAISLLPPADYHLLVERLAVKSAKEKAHDIEMVRKAEQARTDRMRIKEARIEEARIEEARIEEARIEEASIQQTMMD